MLRAVNWSEKLGQLFGGHRGRILRILILFLCALGVLVGIYRARGARIEKEQLQKNKPLKHSATNLLASVSTTKWVIVGNPDAGAEESAGETGSGVGGVGEQYVCSVARVSREAGWKTIIIGDKLHCCRMPDCYSIHKSQFLRMSYRTASTLKTLIDSGKNPQVYKEAIRNLAFIWVIHRGARYVFDAYVDEYISAEVPIPKFEEELSRQLHTLALDESLALVEDRGRSRGNVFRNPYSHFGRPDVRLLPGGPGSSSGAHHAHYHHYNGPLNLAHRHSPSQQNSSTHNDFPQFRICEVRPPSIEKFLEIDEGWWDMRAPALVLPGDTMPPLCTRNTLFSPDVFWALPLLPDYASAGETVEIMELPQNASRIPPWYIRGLWSQSLLGDLGGSIRLTLSRVPTLQLNQDFFAGGDYEPTSSSNKQNSTNKPSSSKLLKRWHCRSRSTFRCLLLMSKELSKSLYLRKNDLSLIESWIIDLKSIHYSEPPMLPRRRSHTNPCLGADGLHGVSFFPALEPNSDFTSDEFVGKRNDTLKTIVTSIDNQTPREKRETVEAQEVKNTKVTPDLPSGLTPPEENSTYYPIDWTTYVSQVTDLPSSSEDETSPLGSVGIRGRDTYYSHFRDTLKELEDASSDFVDTLSDHSSPYTRRVLPFVDKSASSTYGNDPRNAYMTSRSAKQLLQQFPTKSSDANPEEFPILKAMADNMCPGYGPLIPYQPKTTHSDILLIVVFTNQHYDLIPTLEVLYRSAFPNMLYCGHPHVSVDLFLRKYQTVEHRSFSFLPTYTRATYECVLGAMEMNYEVKGYAVITDETLMKSWNINDLDKNKIWVSSSVHDPRHVPVTRNSWPKLDPRGQKLPRLLDGIINTWKLFSYILVGQDSWLSEPKGIKKRSVVDDGPEVRHQSSTEVEEGETLDTGAASYVPVQTPYQWSSPPGDQNQNDTSLVEERLSEKKNSLQQSEGENNSNGKAEWDRDLSVSDWDSIKAAGFGRVIIDENSNNNQNNGTDDEVGDVEVGGDEDESTDFSQASSSGSTPTPTNTNSDSNKNAQNTQNLDPIFLTTPPSDNIDNSTSVWLEVEITGENSEGISSTTETPEIESSVGVPLYHVEHTESPTPPTWHKPEDVFVTSTESISLASFNESASAPIASNSNSSEEVKGQSSVEKTDERLTSAGSSAITQEGLEGQSSTTASSQGPVSGSSTVSYGSGGVESSSVPPSVHHGGSDDGELKKEMEILLDSLQDIYLHMLGVVSEYKEANETSKSHEFSSEVVTEPSSLLEDGKSHRISPREFRHIRCSLQDDGHQSDLCSTLRSYVSTLGQNLGGEIELDHDTIPMYYLPSWTTKPFYSVANVLLHFGVMDELALPLLFRGLALESDWLNLNRSPDLKVISSNNNNNPSGSGSAEESSLAHYFHPFHLHKVYSDPDKRKLFCSNYLLKVFQM